MPRLVNHDERRADVSEIACKIIARDGIEAATVRRVAEEAKCSTTLVSHYFTNKHQLLLFTYRTASSQARRQIERRLAQNPTDLGGCLKALLPLNKDGVQSWKIWFAFWGMAIGDAQFAREHRGYLRRVTKLVSSILQQRYGGRNQRERNAIEARRLFALISGLAAQSIFDPVICSPKLLEELVEMEVARLDQVHDTRRVTR